MAWSVETINGVETIIGHIGDPLLIEVEFEFEWEVGDPAIDFSDHTWLGQIRRKVSSDTAIDMELVESDVTVDVDTRTSTVRLLFGLDDTTVLEDSVSYRYGVRAVEGTYSLWTGIASDPLIGYVVVPRPDPEPGP